MSLVVNIIEVLSFVLAALSVLQEDALMHPPCIQFSLGQPLYILISESGQPLPDPVCTVSPGHLVNKADTQ